MKITVIIPFFQNERGLLSRAVGSVFSQVTPAHWRIDVIVVDDGSPASAFDEDLCPTPPNFSFAILKQENRGVGAARNAGLLATDPSTHCIAFLDSDDAWTPLHLEMGIGEIEAGSDFYFDNNEVDLGIHAFTYSHILRSRHGLIDPSTPVIGILSGAEAFEAFLQESLPHTSQVVYDYQRHRDVRFHTGIRRSGEDLLFWLEIVSRSKRVSYSTGIFGLRGRGVSIFRETLSWDSPNVLDRLVDEMLMRKIIRQSFVLTNEQARIVKLGMQSSCNHFTLIAIRNFARHPKRLLNALWRVTHECPYFWTFVPSTLLELVLHVFKVGDNHKDNFDRRLSSRQI